MRVRCITLNVQGLENDWFKKRSKIVAAGLRKYRPDVVCLQESTVRYANGIYNQAQAIGEAAGLNSVAFSPYGNPIEIMSPNQGGIAVLSRWPIQATRNRRLPTAHDTPPDARVVLLVTLKTSRGTLDVVTTHLSWHPPEGPLRLTQLGMVIDEFSSNEWTDPSSRAILVGDFNATEDEPAIHLASERLKDAYRSLHADEPGYTWLSRNPLIREFKNMPDRRLDYVFCPHAVRVRRAEVIFNRRDGIGYASDHLGVLVDLEWPSHKSSSRRRRQT